ncbi:iron-sulfur cluster assembly scaffold protein NifU [Paraoerskovia sediminicola]|uniref:Iron-sulfur cluster assembly scaffold protein NifU n=1 Tax=Paraoerskovia sediminicola TaxID=1138587 RepID=A0ABM8G6J2_9CELL|nr:SUF system NifU family Fe-S cluster assembly protein [Paraoerskovia sediminicola]BDZ43750.1 iron-sulfur cluster assembly scaffold protein NifU [Paraoerskovia sediminicola]
MSSLEQMYQQVILDHAKSPQGKGLIEIAPGHVGSESHQVNPTCGDEVTLRVDVVERPGADGVPVATVDAVSWEGQGCSISQASISVLHDLVAGQPVTEAERLGEIFRELMTTRGKGLEDDDDEEAIGDAVAFTGVSQYPARIKCALLGWAALKDSLVTAGVLTTKEQA